MSKKNKANKATKAVKARNGVCIVRLGAGLTMSIEDDGECQVSFRRFCS